MRSPHIAIRCSVSSVLAVASIAALLTLSLSLAHAGDVGNPTTPRPVGPQGWLAAPLTLPLASVPPWARIAAQASVTTLPSDPQYQKEVDETAIRLYQVCLTLGSRCHQPTVEQVEGLQPNGSPFATESAHPTVPSGSPYDGTSETATFIIWFLSGVLLTRPQRRIQPI